MSDISTSTKRLVVAIDGPVGTGKSTVARLLAARLGFTYIDTGAMYRCVTLAAMQAGIDPFDTEGVADLAAALDIHLETQTVSEPTSTSSNVNQRIILNGKDVSEAIRAPEISRATSPVADNPEVRSVLVAKQRTLGRNGGVVMEGRDIGTVVFPNADVKFYLDANAHVRAERRHRELLAKGVSVSLQETLNDLMERDERDRCRPVGALRQAEDAVPIDSTNMSVEEVVNRMEAIVRER